MTLQLSQDYSKLNSFDKLNEKELGFLKFDFSYLLSSVLQDLGCDEYFIRSIVLSTFFSYTSDKNTYHNPLHIMHIFDFALKNDLDLESWEVLSLFYHDVIYRPLSKNNEKNSVNFMLSLLSDCEISMEHLIKASYGIYKTALHLENDVEEEFIRIMDLDLASFSYDTDIFIENVNNIEKEYFRPNSSSFKSIPEEEFLLKRKDFLNKMKSKKSIFRSSYFINKYENKAQENLKFALENIEKRIIALP